MNKMYKYFLLFSRILFFSKIKNLTKNIQKRYLVISQMAAKKKKDWKDITLVRYNKF